ncbi:MAG: ester cyclase [Gemmatimonadota bacterium]
MVGQAVNRQAPIGRAAIVRALALALVVAGLAVGCGADPRAQLEPRVERYVEMWNTARFEGIDELLTDDFQLVESPGFAPSTGIEDFKQTVLAYHRSYPDFHITVDEVIYGRDAVAAVWTIRATRGLGPGPGPLTATGKRVEVTGMSVIHFRDGKVHDEWIASNDYEWYRQLGYRLTAPAGARNW